MSGDEAAAAGMEVARTALLALADNDETAALAAINTASHEVTAWACATLLMALRECIAGRVGNKPHRVAMALRAGAKGMDEDIVLTQVALIVNQAERDAG